MSSVSGPRRTRRCADSRKRHCAIPLSPPLLQFHHPLSWQQYLAIATHMLSPSGSPNEEITLCESQNSVDQRSWSHAGQVPKLCVRLFLTRSEERRVGKEC